jgi:hypothetical protein
MSASQDVSNQSVPPHHPASLLGIEAWRRPTPGAMPAVVLSAGPTWPLLVIVTAVLNSGRSAPDGCFVRAATPNARISCLLYTARSSPGTPFGGDGGETAGPSWAALLAAFLGWARGGTSEQGRLHSAIAAGRDDYRS